jgi:hypothetical protein
MSGSIQHREYGFERIARDARTYDFMDGMRVWFDLGINAGSRDRPGTWRPCSAWAWRPACLPAATRG